MKKNILKFLRRGLIAGGFGPIVLAIVYLILHRQIAVDTLNINQVCRGIFSIYALAFIAGGMNIVYQFEKITINDGDFNSWQYFIYLLFGYLFV